MSLSVLITSHNSPQKHHIKSQHWAARIKIALKKSDAGGLPAVWTTSALSFQAADTNTTTGTTGPPPPGEEEEEVEEAYWAEGSCPGRSSMGGGGGWSECLGGRR